MWLSRKIWRGPGDRGFGVRLSAFLSERCQREGARYRRSYPYMTEKRLAKNPEEFGKGAIEAVAGPEAANNAAAAGVLAPLLTLGLPTSATAAIMLAAFQQYGLQPGPLLFDNNPNLVWAHDREPVYRQRALAGPQSSARRRVGKAACHTTSLALRRISRIRHARCVHAAQQPRGSRDPLDDRVRRLRHEGPERAGGSLHRWTIWGRSRSSNSVARSPSARAILRYSSTR